MSGGNRITPGKLAEVLVAEAASELVNLAGHPDSWAARCLGRLVEVVDVYPNLGIQDYRYASWLRLALPGSRPDV